MASNEEPDSTTNFTNEEEEKDERDKLKLLLMKEMGGTTFNKKSEPNTVVEEEDDPNTVVEEEDDQTTSVPKINIELATESSDQSVDKDESLEIPPTKEVEEEKREFDSGSDVKLTDDHVDSSDCTENRMEENRSSENIDHDCEKKSDNGSIGSESANLSGDLSSPNSKDANDMPNDMPNESDENKTMHVAVSHLSPLEVEECTPGLPIPLDSPQDDDKDQVPKNKTIAVELHNDSDFNEDKENVPVDEKSIVKRPPPVSPKFDEKSDSMPVRPPRPPPPKAGFRQKSQYCIEDDAELYANREEIIRREEKNKLRKTMSLNRGSREQSPIYDDILGQNNSNRSATMQGNVSLSGHKKRKMPLAGFISRVKRRFSTRESSSKPSHHDNGYRNDSPIYLNVQKSHRRDFGESNDSILSIDSHRSSNSPQVPPKRPTSPPSGSLRRSHTMPYNRESPGRYYKDDRPIPPCVSFPTTTVISVIYPEPPCPSFPTMCGSPAVAPPVPPCVSFPTTTSSPARPPVLDDESVVHRKSTNLSPPPRPPSLSPRSHLTRSASALTRSTSPPSRPLSPPPIYGTTNMLSMTKPVRPARPPSLPQVTPIMEIIQEEPATEKSENVEDNKESEETNKESERHIESDVEVKEEVSVQMHATPSSIRKSYSLSRPTRPPPVSQDKIVLRRSQTLDRTRPQSERPALSDTSSFNNLYPILERLKKRSSMRDEYSWRIAAATTTDEEEGAPKSTSFFTSQTGGEDSQLVLRQLMEDAVKNFLVAWRNQVSTEMNKMPSYIGHDSSNMFVSQAVNGWKGLTVYTNKRTQDRFMFAEEQSPSNEIASSGSTFVDLLDAYLNCEARLRPSNTFPSDHIATLEDCFDSKLSEISRILLLLNALLTFQKVAHRLDPGVTLDTDPTNILVIASSWNQLIIFRRRLSPVEGCDPANYYEAAEKDFLVELKRLHSGFLADMLECAVTVHQAIQRSIQRVFHLIQKEGGIPASVYLMPHLFPSLQPPDMIAYAITRIYAFKTGVE